MPLEVHDYLVAQGWGGKGTGLRQGAISRPLAIPQKKNLAGLGKDRDEAFPFWDHLFDAAAKSIQLKCFSDDEDETNETSTSTNGVSMKKTSTGIFSTRRPVDGTPADSGSTTPNEADSDSQIPRLSIMAIAKRDAAKRRLYAQFFRGPVLGPETVAEEEKRLAAMVQEAFDKQNLDLQSVTITEHIEVQTADERMTIDLEVSKSKSSGKKRKFEDAVEGALESDSDGDDENIRKERKEKRKEKKRRKEEKEVAKLKRKEEKKAKEGEKSVNKDCTASSSSPKHTKADNGNDIDRTERRERKEEKRRLKALSNLCQESAVTDGAAVSEKKIVVAEAPKACKEKSSSPKKSKVKDDGNEAAEKKKKKKKKRKREDNPNTSS